MMPSMMPAPARASRRAATAALTDEEIVAALARRQIEATPSSPEDLAAFIRAETTKWAPIVRASGATPG